MSTKFSSYALSLAKLLGHVDRAHLVEHVRFKALPEHVETVLRYLPEYLRVTGQESITDWADVCTALRASGVQDNDGEIGRFLDSMERYEASGHAEVLPLDALQQHIDMAYTDRIVDAFVKAGHSSTPELFHTAIDIMDGYVADSVILNRNLASDASGASVEDDFTEMVREGMSWPWKGLDELIGPLANELVVVAARPDGGKSSFLGQVAWNYARQFNAEGKGKKVLWFNNEEAIQVVRRRVIRSALGKTAKQIAADPVSAQQDYAELIGDSMVFVDNANSVTKIERLISKYDPGLIVIDQLYKLESGRFGKASDVEAERFRKMCQWARELGKAHCPILVTNQLDASAEGEMYPPMGSLYGSKTGMQGEVDVIVMIGASHEDPYKKAISTAKNKLTGIRNKAVYLELDVSTSRFREV